MKNFWQLTYFEIFHINLLCLLFYIIILDYSIVPFYERTEWNYFHCADYRKRVNIVYDKFYSILYFWKSAPFSKSEMDENYSYYKEIEDGEVSYFTNVFCCLYVLTLTNVISEAWVAIRLRIRSLINFKEFIYLLSCILVY